MDGPLLRYRDPDSSQTLREGLAEYYARNPGLLDPEGLEPVVAEAFRRHDAGHVVFAYDTSLRGEALIDTWTVFATTAGLRGYLEYFRYPQVNDIFAEVGWARSGLETLRCMPDVLRVLARSRRLARRWPWAGWHEHLDRPLREIRKGFGIHPV